MNHCFVPFEERPSRREPTARRFTRVMPFLAISWFGCSSQDVTRFDPPDPGPEIREESLVGGAVSLQPEDLSASLAAARRVELTARASAVEPSAGFFVVELRSVDNRDRYSAARMHYDFSAAGAVAPLRAELALPRGAEPGPGLIRYNVVVSSFEGVWVTRSLLHVLPPEAVTDDTSSEPWQALLADSRDQLEPFLEPLREALNRDLSENLDIGLTEMDRRGCPPEEYCERLDAEFFPAMRREYARLHPILDFWGNPYANEPAEPSEIARLTSAGADEEFDTSDDFTLSFDYFDLDFAAAGLSESEAQRHGPGE